MNTNKDKINAIIDSARRKTQIIPDQALDIKASFRKLMRTRDKSWLQFPFSKSTKVNSSSNQVNPYVGEAIDGNSFFESLKQIINKIAASPSINFHIISDKEALGCEDDSELTKSIVSDLNITNIEDFEELLRDNMVDLLKKHDLYDLWLGSEIVLQNTDNPDRYRQSLISIRTLLEDIIHIKIAPLDLIKDESFFKNEFRNYHNGRKPIEKVKVHKTKILEWFNTKIQLGIADIPNSTKFIYNIYEYLCVVHEARIELNEYQIRCLRVKSGIAIWLLIAAYQRCNQTKS